MTAQPEPNQVLHDSDCALHNEPAYPNGPCDCSVSRPLKDGEGGLGSISAEKAEIPTEQTDEPAAPAEIDWRAPLPNALWEHFVDSYGLSNEEACEAGGEILDIIASHPVAAEGEVAGRTEAVAKLVYEAMTWAAQNAEEGNVPPWVDGGNALAQGCARGLVPRILSVLFDHPAPGPKTHDDLVSMIRGYLDADDPTHWGAFEKALHDLISPEAKSFELPLARSMGA